MSKKAANPLPLNDNETLRLYELQAFEREARAAGFTHIAGVDEAGRGPLAGPVVAAACSMPEHTLIPGINDSKKLTPKQRLTLFNILTTHPNINFGIGIVSPKEIDRINILQATIVAMNQAIDNLTKKPEFLLVDGLQIPSHPIPNRKIIKGDSRCYLIAAASIIAKETRDKLMLEYHEKWPQYGFDKHKGYGTQQHRNNIQQHGPCPIHRMTFEPLKSLFSPDLFSDG